MKHRVFLSSIWHYTLSFLLLVLFGCIEDDYSSLNKGNQRLTASIIEESSATRAILKDNPTNQKMEVKWKAGDAIGVFGSSSGKNVHYETNQAYISEDGKSTVFETTATAAEGNLTVYYPYQQGAAITSEGVLQLTMPATQAYITEQTAVVSPDPAANMMSGKGKEGNIAFRNLFALLRINIAGSDGQMVKKVLFTDLSGKPVSGKFSVTWSGDIPKAEFPQTGTGKDLQIELDCGSGVAVGNNSLTKFFLIVPARNYEKGFKVEFVLASGDKITKTIGATGGKILLRNMLYPIGDMFPNQDDKVSYTLHEKASIITEERYDLINKATLDTTSYNLTLIVADGFAPQKDEIILINRTSASLPKGYVGKVTSISGLTVVLEPITDLTHVFNELSIGKPLWGSGGTPVADGGYTIDLSQYITSIETPDGKPVEFAIDGSALNMQVPITRAEAEVDTKYKSPMLSHTFSLSDPANTNNSSGLKLGVQMDIAMYFHILIQRITLKDLQCRINPTVTFSSDFNIDWVTDGNTFGTEIPFAIVRVAAIPAGPILIIPLIEFYLTFDLEGKVGLTAQLSYSKEFLVGVAYQNGELTNYASVVQPKVEKSPWGFSPNVQLEGSLSVGVAPKIGFTIWEMIRLDTRLYNKVKGGANLNFNLASPSFDPSIYNAISGSKLFSQLELYMEGGIYGWRNKKWAATKSTTLEYPLWEAYFVPKLENFAITAQGGELDILLDVSNKLFFKSEIGMNIYEKDEKTGQFTVKVGTMKLCEYSKPPEGKEYYNLKLKEASSLPPDKEYEARLTVSLDAPGGPYSIETDVKTKFTTSNNPIIITTTKYIGEKIKLYLDAGYDDKKDVWIDLNNNGKKDMDEEVTKFKEMVSYTLKSQTLSIYGNVTALHCDNNQITVIDVRGHRTLRGIMCGENKLTSLDLRGCTALESLWCINNELTSLNIRECVNIIDIYCWKNQLTSLDVSGCRALKIIHCYENKLTTLNIKECVGLWDIYCYDNQLTSLDVSSCKALEDLRCQNNQLTSLNVSGCTALNRLECNNNQLTTLDVSGCNALIKLWCNENKLTKLNTKKCVNLTHIYCNDNQITSLDVSGCKALKSLNCNNNQLTTLDVNDCSALVYFYCSGNQLTALDVSNCSSLNIYHCYDNNLSGVRPDYFNNYSYVAYDIRFEYKWSEIKNKWVVAKDNGKGFWYSHEPDGGCHNPEPCNK